MPEGTYQYRKSSRSWILAAAASLLIVATLVIVLKRETAVPAASKSDLVVYCAAGIRKPVEAAAKQYEEEFNVRIRLDYGSSGEMESKLGLEQESGVSRCDLYIPADRFFSDRAREKGLTEESILLGKQHVVVAIKPSGHESFDSVASLLTKRRPFVICDEQAGVGKKTKTELQKHGLWAAVNEKKKSSFPRVPEAANAVKTSEMIDAAFIWDATARQFGLKVVECPELSESYATISADVTSTTENPKAALHFARYLAAPEKGKAFFDQYHFDPVPGDSWAEVPELVIYCGGVNRNAVAQTLKDFEEREGCVIKTHYAGCGTIVGNIKAGKFNLPDAFMTCDASYMTMVESDFMEASDVSSTQVVIMVRKGNPKGIHGIEDLAKAGVSVGTTDPKMSTLGALSWRMFEETGIKPSLEQNQNVIVTTPTAHELILQMEGHTKLDAALVYEANCQNLTDKFELIPIDRPTAKAVQNIAVGRNSEHAQMSSRLMSAILSTTSRERFLGEGFSWEAIVETK